MGTAAETAAQRVGPAAAAAAALTVEPAELVAPAELVGAKVAARIEVRSQRNRSRTRTRGCPTCFWARMDPCRAGLRRRKPGSAECKPTAPRLDICCCTEEALAEAGTATAKEAVEAEQALGDMAAATATVGAVANRVAAAARMAPRDQGGPMRPALRGPPRPFQPAPMPSRRCRNTRTPRRGVARPKSKGSCWAVKMAPPRHFPLPDDQTCELAWSERWTPLQSWHAGSAAIAAAASAPCPYSCTLVAPCPCPSPYSCAQPLLS